MSKFDKIRQSVPGLRNASDEEILRDIASTTGYNDGDVAKVFGYGQSGGLASNRVGAGIDNYQANLYGVGEAVAGAVGLDGVASSMKRRRESNEFQANVSSQRASELGGVDDWRDVDGIGSGLNYVGGLAAQSLPYLGEAAAGGLVARGLMTGTRAAMRGAQTLEAANAARKTLNVGSTAGAVAASYPSAVGDILSNQRDEIEQSGQGEIDLGAAALGGVPYAAMNAVGVEGIVARGLRPLSQGGGNLLKRVAVEGGKAMVTEGASETGQEVVNQVAGRMAVNPEETVFNEEANKRYVDSFVGGAALGGVVGGAAGIRRPLGDGDLLKPPEAREEPGTDVPPPPPPQLPYDGRAGEIITFSDGSAALRSELEAQQDFPRRPMDPAIQAELDAKAQADAEAAQRTQAIKARVEAVKQERIAQEQAEQKIAAERTTRAKEFGVELKGKAQLETFGAMEAALDEGLIDTDAYAVNLGLLGANKHGEVKKNLEGATLLRRLVEVRSTGMINDPMFKEAEQQIKDGQFRQVEKFIEGALASQPTGDSNAALTPAQTPAAPAGDVAKAKPAKTAGKQTPAPAPSQPAAPAGVPPARGPEPVQPAGVVAPAGEAPTVQVGRSAREVGVTKEQLSAKLAAATPIDRQRILDAMGMEQDTDPTTGAPTIITVAEPRTFDQVAQLEAQRTGKKVSKQAISQALLKFGITEDVINQTVGASGNTVSDAELGIDPAANGSGFRVEQQLSKATNQGLVDDGNTQTKDQEKIEAQADKLLKEAGPSEVVDAIPEGATDLREQNPAIQAENVRTLLGHVEAENAAADWDGSTVPWDTLPDTLKADWVTEYVWNLKANEGDLDFKELESAQANIERDYRAYRDNQSVQAPARPSGPGLTGAGSRTGVVAGKQAAKPAVPAADAGSGKAQAKVDPAQQAWDKLRAGVPQMPAFEVLNERQKKQVADLVSREVFNLAAANTVASDINQDVLGPQVPVNKDVLESRGKATKGSTVEAVTTAVKQFLRVDTLGRNVFVVQSLSDLPAGLRQESKLDGATQGVAVFDGKGGRKVYLIASQIAPGKAKSVFMHEVGAHIGLEQLLNPAEFKALTGQITTWAKAGMAAKGKMTTEQQLAVAAANRAMDAGVDRANLDSELLAYFIEEAVDAGIDPSVTKETGPVATWLRRVMQAFSRALIKLGVKPETLTAQDLVDLAYGAAEIEVRTGAAAAPEVASMQVSKAEFSTAFQRWFGDSKVVDENGKPLVVYHGSLRDFDSFDPDASRFGNKGLYFTADAGYASAFARTGRGQTEGSPTVYPVYLSIKNPLVLGNGRFDPASLKGRVAAALFPAQVKTALAANNLRDDLGIGSLLTAKNVADLRAAGFDGVFTEGGAFIALAPEQIKSATGNNGNYDPSSPRIQESRAKPVGIPSIDRAPELVSNVVQSFKDGASWLGLRTMFTEDLIALATKVIPSARGYKAAMDKIEVARGAMERDVVKILQDFRSLAAHEQGKGPGSVNGLLMDSTMQREWAFKPEWAKDPVSVNPALAVRFNALSPDAQALVKRVFKHGHDTLQQMQAAVKSNVAAEYDTAIAEARAAGNTAQVTKLTNKKAKEIADFQSMLDMRSTWPYAPLKRFGKHVVMGYSAQYAAAKAANNVPEMQRLQKDGDHYYVGFAETKAQARAMLAEIAPTFNGGETGTFEKLDGVEAFMGGRDMLGAFQRLRTLANEQKNDDGKTNERIDNMMRQMYLTLLSETSARKSELHRRNIAGADGDMMRAFATQGRATAHFVAGLQTNGQVNDLLRDMKNQVSETLGDREQKQAYFNEIMRRHSMNLEYAPSGMVEKAMAGTSVWMLLTNPSYFLVNATQPFMMSAPLMGARYGYARANVELLRAFKEVAPALKDAKFTEDDYSALPKDTQRAVEELANMGVIDISLESVLGKFGDSRNPLMSKLDPVMERMNGAAQAVESMNRLSTAIAAYRLAGGQGNHAQAVKYAAQVIYETHGDYSGFNAPRFMRRGVGKLATQFRKFQLIQLSMFARLLNRAFKDADANERYIAKKALALNLAHLGAAGGLMGMPAFSMIAWVIGKAIPGDDEPDDPEATLRRLIGDKALADLLLKGAPKLLGVDISGRVGAGGMLSLLPYTDVELSRDGYAAAVTGLLGPFVGGLAPKVVDGIGQIAQGNLWKGTEQMMPTGLANVLKATRFADQGVTKRNGDVVLSADEVGFLDAMAQAVGLPTNTTTDRSFLASAQFKSDTFYRERTTQLKNQYAAAVRKNDTQAMQEVREEWMQTQAARRKLGYEAQPMSTLLRAPQEQMKRERDTVAGVQTSRSSKGFVAPLI